MKAALYILACVVVPAVWGLVASTVYDRLYGSREQTKPPEEQADNMFHI